MPPLAKRKGCPYKLDEEQVIVKGPKEAYSKSEGPMVTVSGRCVFPLQLPGMRDNTAQQLTIRMGWF